MNPIPLCHFEAAQYLFFSSNVPPLVYFSHFPALLFSVGFALYVLFAARGSLSARILFGSLLPFAIWIFFNLIVWATNRSDIIMFLWSLQIMVEPMVYAGLLYLLHVTTAKRDAPFWVKALVVALFLPLLAIVPTSLNLTAFDLAYCIPVEGFYAYYSYVLELGFILWILAYGIYAFRRTPDTNLRKQILVLMASIVLFLAAFASGNVIGSFTDDWNLAQVGLFGTPVFIMALAFLTARFHLFRIQLLMAQVLVFAQIALIFSLLFLRSVETVRIVSVFALVFASVLGYFLIRNVVQEIRSREKIEALARDLKTSNEQQVTLIHFITHQLKGFVTKSRNVFSMLLEGDFGQLPDTMKPMVEEGLRSDTKGVNTIQEILNAANIKSGKVTYAKTPVDLKELVGSIVADLKPNADAKSIAINMTSGAEDCTIQGDRMQLTNAVKNLIDNALKYTLQGSVAVALSREAGKLRLAVKDTGVGITPEDMKLLFTEGGHGKESQKVNVESTGFGLYIVRNIVEAHGGKVWAESEGAGKGSRFIVELPIS